jgi:chaperonin cofactor prefoldin
MRNSNNHGDPEMIKQCENEACGKSFEAKRSSARYCGGTCRALASRARRQPGPTRPSTARPAARSVEEERAGIDTAVAARLHKLEARLVALASRIDEGQAKAAQTLRTVTAGLAMDRDDTNERACDLRDQVEAMEKRVKGLEKRARLQAAPVDDARLDRLAHRFEELRREVAHLDERVQEHGQMIATLNRAAAAAMGLVDALS